MNADDLKMLKKAAERAKLKVVQETESSILVQRPGAAYAEHWNPLEIDGEAFRLLAQFKLHVEFEDGEAQVWDDFSDTDVHYITIENDDNAAALRRAIVEVVAAQLGVVEEEEAEEDDDD